MRRRDFIGSAALAAAGAGMSFGQTREQKLERIAIMSLCFSSILKSPAFPNDKERVLDVMDLPQMIVTRYGVHNVEMQHSHFLSTEASYLKEFRDRMKKAKANMNQINVEFGPLNISNPDPIRRLETIDLMKMWLDHAADLGCPRVMVNQGTLAPEIRKEAIATLKVMGDYGKTKKVFVTMENRGGGAAPVNLPPGQVAPYRSTWENVVEVIKGAGIYANPDVGNFPNEEARHAGLRVMYTMTSGSSHCHYAPERYSEADALKIAKEVGYKGLFSVETGRNNGSDPYAATQTILEALLKDM